MELRRRAKQTKLLLLAALVLLSWLATQTISDAILQARFAGHLDPVCVCYRKEATWCGRNKL